MKTKYKVTTRERNEYGKMVSVIRKVSADYYDVINGYHFYKGGDLVYSFPTRNTTIEKITEPL